MRNLNDGSDRPPRLRADLHLGTVWQLPAWSAGPRGDDPSFYETIAAAGYEGVQGGDPVRCRELGLACTTFGVHRGRTAGEERAGGAPPKEQPGRTAGEERAGGAPPREQPGRTAGEERAGGAPPKEPRREPREQGALLDLVKLWRDLGFEAATLHVGTGIESDAEALALLTEVLEASERTGLPLYVETHRATCTQDPWRTVSFIAELPELRFNGDFSHWYTGGEMTYGDFDAKLAFLAPVFERTRYLHGRIGDPGCMQIALGPDVPDDHPSIVHFERFWTAAAAGFLATAAPGDVLPIAPELLPPSIHYARTHPSPDGPVEGSDRWTDALRMVEIAQRCLERAIVASAPSQVGEPA